MNGSEEAIARLADLQYQVITGIVNGVALGFMILALAFIIVTLYHKAEAWRWRRSMRETWANERKEMAKRLTLLRETDEQFDAALKESWHKNGRGLEKFELPAAQIRDLKSAYRHAGASIGEPFRYGFEDVPVCKLKE